jgi:hypothetical protein
MDATAAPEPPRLKYKMTPSNIWHLHRLASHKGLWLRRDPERGIPTGAGMQLEENGFATGELLTYSVQINRKGTFANLIRFIKVTERGKAWLLAHPLDVADAIAKAEAQAKKIEEKRAKAKLDSQRLIDGATPVRRRRR